ncbi:lysylphosphatidylglycerol synthase domain-containing protein [Ramlibacter sp. XY19]|uniref:lysylphosphatidylglycerol synthase domain-containing protein n=1 Tax=Ramlibacter paludis TaxID=2908000 RepID=UPI0023DA6E10|nr:lysylphosphatidylglycerol synthase domain-containing protein [Ramlibacter paludis]MCG2594561.1 lysylphosphatidylglycerol synthase domain-containing protein [Ramlibacter paludis]
MIRKLMAQPWWPWAKRIVGFAFIAVVVALLVRYASTVDWQKVKESILELPRSVLLQALAFAIVSHLIYSLLDLVGRHYTGHKLSKRKVMQVSFTSYAFNLNLGSLVGGIGFRYRLYSKLGLRPGQITRIVTMSMITNWIGYVLLAGVVFSFFPLQLPPNWGIDSEELRLVGVALLAASVAYFGMAAFAKTRSFKIRGVEVFVPSLRMALAQHGISCIHWMTMAAVPWALLQGQIDYPTVLAVLLIAAIAGVMLHIPAGLGVTEAVFVAMLSHRVPEHQLIGALLAFRALFYLLPLVCGALMYLKVEVKARKQAAAA